MHKLKLDPESLTVTTFAAGDGDNQAQSFYDTTFWITTGSGGEEVLCAFECKNSPMPTPP